MLTLETGGEMRADFYSQPEQKCCQSHLRHREKPHQVSLTEYALKSPSRNKAEHVHALKEAGGRERSISCTSHFLNPFKQES